MKDTAFSNEPAPVERIELTAGGAHLSRLVAGCWRLVEQSGADVAEVERFIGRCLDLGISSFDHADIYGHYQVEALFGQALARNLGLRDRIEIVTKCGILPVVPQRPAHRVLHTNTSAAHIRVSVENSLRALHTDRIDLLLLHRPDPLMDADETAQALLDLRSAGKILHFGVSNFAPPQFELLRSRMGTVPLSTHQVELSVMHTDALYDGTIDQCHRLRCAPMAWSPLGGGRLFKADVAQAARVKAVLDALVLVHAEAVGGPDTRVDASTIALAWLLRHPARIVPVLGSIRPERLHRAARACALSLDRKDWQAITTAAEGEPFK